MSPQIKPQVSCRRTSVTLLMVLVVTLRPRGSGGGCQRTHRSSCSACDPALAGPRSDQRARQDARDGLEVVPSIASLARIFRQTGVAWLEPKKKPRSAWRRLIEHTPPAPGVTYVGNGRPADHAPRPLDRRRSPETPTVTDVLIRTVTPCPETSHRLSAGP
jgi:hypothetical protein